MATSRKRSKNNQGGLLQRTAVGLLGRIRQAGWQRPCLGVVLSTALAFLMADYQKSPTVSMDLGAIAERDVEAWTDFKVPNYHLSAEAQRRAETDTSPVFEHDEIVVEELLRRIDQAFGGMHAYFQPSPPEPPISSKRANPPGLPPGAWCDSIPLPTKVQPFRSISNVLVAAASVMTR